MTTQGCLVVLVGALLIGAAGAAPAQDSAAVRDTTRMRAPLTSTFALRGEFLRSLPIDDPRDALALYPGVVSRDDARGVLGRGDVSLRGSAAGEASVYIDGAPARRVLFGTDGMVPGLSAIDQIVVTTGVTGAEVADARGGLIAYTIRSGGPTLAGDVRATSDAFFGDGSTVGYNTFDAWVGGPLPGLRGSTWFLSGVVQGQESRYRSSLAAGIPFYVTGVTDTVVSEVGAGSVVVPQYVQWSGECGATGNANTSIGTSIRDNYGAACHGLGQAMDWSSAQRALGKLAFAYGDGGAVAFTGLVARQQERGFPGEVIGATTLYQGGRATSSLFVANWRQPLSLAGAGAAVRVTLSFGTDQSIAGPLASSSEVATRDPALGIEWGSLRFEGEDILPVPITDAIIRNVRTNTGLRVPYLNRSDLENVQPWRLNPYGLIDNGWYTQGLGTTLTFGDERRLHGNASVEGRPLAGHRVVLGVDADRVTASYYSSYMLNQIQFDAFIVEPRRWGVYVTDSLGLGRGTLELGVRWDRYTSDALYPRTPGRVFTHPRAGLYPAAATDDAVYAAYLADDSIWVGASGQSTPSLRVRGAYPFGAATVLRASYGQQVEPPSLNVLHARANNDLAFTSVRGPFGRDITYATMSAAELGVQHALDDAWTLDAAVYRKTGLRPYAARFSSFADPSGFSGDSLTVAALQRVEGSTATGVDVWLHARWPAWVDATLGYALQRTAPPATASLTTHTVTGVVGLVVPDGGAPGWVLRGVRAYATLRFTNGVHYTRLANSGAGWTLEDGFGSGAVAEPINASTLPWTKHLDVRVDKGWRTAGIQWGVFVDLRNILGFSNQVDVFTETGDIENAGHRIQTIGDPAFPSREYAQLRDEAATAGALAGDGTTIDLRGNCATWGSPVNCVSLVRVENRFGDGDGLYTAAEQERAFNAYYDAFFGSWRFYEPGRTLRVGLQIGF